MKGKKLFWNINLVLIKHNWKVYILNALIWLVISVLPFFLSLIVQAVLEMFQYGKPENGFYLLGLFSLLSVFQIFITFQGGILDTLTRFGIGQHLRNAMFSKAISLNDRVDSSIYININENDIPVIEELLSFEVDFLNKIIYFIIATFILAKVSLKITLCVLLPVFLFSFLILKAGNKLKNLYADSKKEDYKYAAFLGEIVSNMENIWYFSSFSDVSNRLGKILSQRMKKSIKISVFNSLVENAIVLTHHLSIVILLAVSIPFMQNGDMSVGNLTLFIDCLIYGISYLAVFQEVNADYQYGNNLIERLEKMLNIDNAEFLEILQIKEIEKKKNGMKKDFTIHIDDEEVKLEMGKMLLIMGKNGAGKSKFVNSILKSDETKNLLLSYVPEKAHFFDGTLWDNITIFDDISQKDVWNALEIAGLTRDESFLKKFEMDLKIGKNGNMLSDGQRQRTALARALLINSNIIVIDDGLSYVDKPTVESIMKNLKDSGKIIIYASNRKMLMEFADIIYDMSAEKNKRNERR